jgi:hypothetical protein
MFVWGKARIIPLVAIVAIAVLTLVGACLVGGQRGTGTARAPETPVYVRVSVSEKTSVYLEFQGREVRAAMSAEGLTAATPSKPRQEITLPIPADQLPAGITAIKAGLAAAQVASGPGRKTGVQVSGYLAPCRMDDQKAEWQCVVRVGVPAADSADKATAIRLPSLEKPAISVTAKPAKGSLGVGVRLLAGRSNAAPSAAVTSRAGNASVVSVFLNASGPIEVRKDGKPVDVKVTVLDAAGKQVASKTGPLSNFGFS